MKKNILSVLCLSMCFVFMCGCSKSSERQLDAKSNSVEEKSEIRSESSSGENKTEAEKITAEEDVLLNVSEIDFDSKIVKTEKFLISGTSETAEYENGNYSSRYSNFYVLGFSRDGKILFSEKRAVEGRGGYDISFTVQDLVTDEILWNITDKSFGEDSSDFTMKDVVKVHLEELASAVKKYKVLDADFSFSFPPYTDYGKNIDFKMSVKNTEQKEFDFLDIIEYKLTAKSGEKEKIISSERVTAFDAYICGYIKNPYEDRVAVIIAETKYTFEQSEPFYKIIGCSLTDGL